MGYVAVLPHVAIVLGTGSRPGMPQMDTQFRSSVLRSSTHCDGRARQVRWHAYF